MTISNGCFALLLAIGSDLNLYLIGSEIVRDDYVFDFTSISSLPRSHRRGKSKRFAYCFPHMM